MTTARRAGLVLATAGGVAMLSLPSVHARERDETESEPTTTAAADETESEEKTTPKHEEVWEEEKGTFLRPYITSVRVAAQETTDDALAQWKSFKDKTDFDRRWDTTKHHATRYYWLITGHRLGPEITFAVTAGVLTLFATRKVLRLPFRLALLSGGITTAALLPPYEKTVPYLVHQYETFEWAKVADKLDPVALKDAAIDEIKASLPFGLGGKKTAKKDVEEELLEEKKEQHVDVVRPEETHRHAHAASDKACCDDDKKKTESHHQHHHADADKKEHHHHHQERHHHDEEKEVLDVEPLSDKEDEDVQ